MIKVMEGYENTTPRRISVKGGNSYAVFPDGRIYRLLKHDKLHKSLKPYVHEYRHTVQLGRTRTVVIANIVAMCYRPNPCGYSTVRYDDADPGNYTRGNLSWSSCSNLQYSNRYKHKVFAVTTRLQLGDLESIPTYVAFFDNAADALSFVLGEHNVTQEQVQQVASGRYIALPRHCDITTVAYSAAENVTLYNEDNVLSKHCRCCGKLKPLTEYSVNGTSIRTACKSCASTNVVELTRRRKENAKNNTNSETRDS